MLAALVKNALSWRWTPWIPTFPSSTGQDIQATSMPSLRRKIEGAPFAC
jgi:hypothetical protein